MRALDPPAEIAADLAALGPCILSASDLALCRDAEDLMRRARDRAERWEEAARGRCDAVHAEARQAGRVEGIESAMAEIARLGRALADLRAAQERDLRALAIAVIRRIFAELPDDERIAAAARRALAENPRIDAGRLAVHPADAGAVAVRLAACGRIEVVAEAALAPGHARLDTALGAIALSAERQLAVAEAMLAPPEALGASDG